MADLFSGTLLPDTTNPIRIRTPYAAVLIWNYNERLSSNPFADPNSVEDFVVSTVSTVSIRTSKSKGDPQGNFQFVLAPTRNWVSTITPGSWCAILMSNKPITQADTIAVDPDKLKMIGKIDTVRVDTKVDDQGARTTMYYVQGVDWGHIFNNVIYIDANLARPSDPTNLGNSAAISIQNMLFGVKGMPKRFTTTDSLKALMEAFGKDLLGFGDAGRQLKLLANAVYNINMPTKMALYLGLKGSIGLPSTNLNGLITLETGALNTVEDVYTDTKESYGFIDPFSLQGQHTFWQVLMDNSNPTMCEMIAEIRPGSIGGLPNTKLMLYNRIKPFIVKNSAISLPLRGIPGADKTTSFFQNVKKHTIDPMTVISVNAGTNWRDKYNFIEIKPAFQDQRTIEPVLKTATQAFDEQSFSREGFRPLIFTTKHFPGPVFEGPSLTAANWNELAGWCQVLKAWYFDTHKMLNGTIELTGIDGYIAVGDNIQFDAQLVNPNKNFNSIQAKTPTTTYVLGHVENVSHSFAIQQNGAREYRTTIQFVRGILTTEDGLPVSIPTSVGAIDHQASSLTQKQDRNTANTFSTGGSLPKLIEDKDK